MTDQILSDKDLDVIFRKARSFKGWQDRPVSEITIRAMYDLLRWGPTSFNSSPARFVIAQSEEAKEKLAACAMKSNRSKILTAPFTVIVAYDLDFPKTLDRLFKLTPGVSKFFEGNNDFTRVTALRNGSLQGAYMMIAARALGLDCCPMSGFDEKAVNETFFKDSSVRVNFLCAMGYGDPASLPPQEDRLGFDEACTII
ncbi:malonic semialdehyde reductase [Luteithermobacter gelatinilyticus]|uniref:malonic semialdehyde reductase n=1 Tax=Luteithermobacter gelatinilyticus TaxID=2582913 RepID=UPI001106498A|nr:malonic semialdehyde reductase [Luteithermobacter gelatinilyticus]|tara:strand:- start:7230 stop:7826 length:597 start_codon:yes stop_codon:yes gene_type:complete